MWVLDIWLGTLTCRQYHYGNNIYMPAGTYRVSVHANQAYATYTVRL